MEGNIRDEAQAPTPPKRAMVRAQLLGGHSHACVSGTRVHIYRRSEAYLARGRIFGRIFGETLGSNEVEATTRLRQLLVEIDDGSYVRPSEARKRPLSAGRVPRLTVRQLVSEFLAEKRRVRGRRTAETYRGRLRPVLDFAEQPEARKRWPLAVDVDREFVLGLRGFLYQAETTPNGRAGARPRRLSVRQICNVLECFRSAVLWARQAEVRKLPVGWPNPLTRDLIPTAPAKDPLRHDPLPVEARVKLVGLMDRWQLCHLVLSAVLPLRPQEATGLLVSDVDFGKGWLRIGTRLGGNDFTKGRTAFVLPFPAELRPLLHACIGGRAEGPLLRSRAAFEGRGTPRSLSSFEELTGHLEAKLNGAPPEAVLTEQDRKAVFRRLLQELGGVSEDQLARECKALFDAASVGGRVTLYNLRGSVTQSMKVAGLTHLDLRYLTSHSTTDILNAYVGLDPVGAMNAYFQAVRPLLTAIEERAAELGCTHEETSQR
jgi:integrase